MMDSKLKHGGSVNNALLALKPGERASGRLGMGTMASGQTIDLPYLVMRGMQDGPCLWLNGAVHGDEINGVLAALDFYRALDPSQMRGRVVVTPVSNPLGFDARRKRVPQDELDLDQSFPGRADGLASERLAWTLFSEIRDVADVLVNFHTMNPYFDSKPYVVYKIGSAQVTDEKTLLAAAATFDPFVVCRMPVDGGSELPGNVAGALDYQGLKAGLLAFMVELGGGSRQEPAYIAQGVRGLFRLAQHIGLLEADGWEPGSVQRVTRRRHVMCSHGGLFRQQAVAGSIVPAGQPIGIVESVWGEELEKIVFDAPVALIGLRTDPVVHSGDRVAFVGTEWSLLHA
ncbi:M14 family metallopeptidase [Mesorhizobium muleiense]|uniref:M14 family metallopeptidase n=1 Tax=Mesorhizobium muleiense TaxID=1004279 RepID=UPI003AFB1FB1